MDWNITREFGWHIPTLYLVTMYVTFVIAMAIVAKGIYDKYKLIKSSRGSDATDNLIPEKLNWCNFLKTITITGKVPRSPFVGFFHSLIFFGFIALIIATILAGIHMDSPFKIFVGPIYKVFSFCADIAGILILLGVVIAFVRRYISKPEQLSATNPNRELVMYGMIFVLIVIGYLVEGIRIYGTHAMVVEKSIAPIGWWIAKMISNSQPAESSIITSYQTLWGIHMLTTMIFLVMLVYSKFNHIILVPLSALLTPYRRGAILDPMNFENEEAETFGLGKISELSTKNVFDTLACVECGRCSEACSAKLADKPLDPKKIVTKTRDFINDKLKNGEKDGDFWEANLFTSDELDSCTTCGACMEECPSNIEHVNLILNLKRYKALTLGEIPTDAGNTVNNIKVQSNPWGIAADDRNKWAEGLDVPMAEPGKKVDYLYYIGCAGSFDESNQKVAKDIISIFKKANVDFAIIGNTEQCCGDPIRRFGDEYTFYEVALGNIELFGKYDFDKIVVHCPHCMHTLGKEYAKFEGGEFEVVHHTELIADLIKTGKITPKKDVDEDLIFHDPCYLGRHHNQYDAPRSILKSIPGVTVREMNRTKDTSLCCGMGGGNMWYEIAEGKHLAENRLEEIGKLDASKLITACSYCMINFNSSKGSLESTENLEVQDVAQILAKSL